MSLDIKAFVETQFPLLVEIRRHCHEYPELSWQETKTLAYIAEKLDSWHIPFQSIEKGGIAAILESGRPGPTLLLRADIDALPVQEGPKNLSQKRMCISCVPGVMHACGHDGHIAMLLVAAKILHEWKDTWSGTIICLFEQGEEDSHAMEYIVPWLETKSGYHIDGCYATHLRWDIPTGKIAICSDAPMAGGFRFDITIHGQGGHGSRPDLCHSPIDCFSAFNQELQGLRLRTVPPRQCLAVSIGSLHSGELQNVVPQDLTFGGTCRYFDYDQAGKPFYDEFYHLLDHTCASHHCSWTSGPVPKPLYEVHNDPTCATLAEMAITASLGEDVLTTCDPWMASETFAILTRLYPGVLTFTGIANPSKGTGGNHHTPEFDLDEDALVYGTTACISYALAFLKEKPQPRFTRTDEPLEELAARNV